ncbi:MAG TPA: hypothetical protein VJM31_04320 [Vicinamibacterales bacterium]|nr:hypothetical protein [Vicinamibacterales bacterium]
MHRCSEDVVLASGERRTGRPPPTFFEKVPRGLKQIPRSISGKQNRQPNCILLVREREFVQGDRVLARGANVCLNRVQGCVRYCYASLSLALFDLLSKTNTRTQKYECVSEFVKTSDAHQERRWRCSTGARESLLNVKLG